MIFYFKLIISTQFKSIHQELFKLLYQVDCSEWWFAGIVPKHTNTLTESFYFVNNNIWYLLNNEAYLAVGSVRPSVCHFLENGEISNFVPQRKVLWLFKFEIFFKNLTIQKHSHSSKFFS